MASKYPGKRCIKKVADMTPKELRDNREYTCAYSKCRRANRTVKKKAAENKASRIYQALPENRARCLAYHKKRKQENPEKHKKYVKKGIDELSRSYVKNRLQKQLGLRFSEIPEILVQLKRAQIKLRRMAND